MLDKKIERFLPLLVAITFFMQMLDMTIVNTALPSIANSLQANPLQMQSVTISYVLTVALLIPASSWFTDRLGLRNVFMSAIVLFSLGSLACALATTLPELVGARILQGIGGAILTPVGRLSILRAFPKEKLVQVLSFISVPALVGPLVGPTLGGLLVDYISWHWIFLINIPVGVLAILATLKYMPNFEPLETLHKFDWVGFLLFGSSMILLIFGIQGIGELHLPFVYVGLFLGGGLFFLCCYIWHGAHTEYPLFATGLFDTRNFTIGIIGNMTARLGMSGMPFIVPLFLQVGLGFSPVDAGMALIPMSVGAILGKSFTQPILVRTGYRLALTFNTTLLGLIIASFSILANVENAHIIRIVLFTFFGIINSMQFTIMNTLTLIDLPKKHAGSGNSLLSVVMQLGVSVGVAIAATILGIFSGTQDTHGPELRNAFIYTFWCLGSLTFIASFVFLNIHNTNIDGTQLKNPLH